MPLWLVIMVLGAAGCGWLFLKARQSEAEQVKKKVAQGSETVKAQAKKASGEIGMPPIEPIEILKAEQAVGMSKDLPSNIAKQLEKILSKEQE